METIGERITRLRNGKGWSRAELGREMQKAIKREKPFSGEVVRLYEEDINKPGASARRALANVFERSEVFIEFGITAEEDSKTLRQPTATYMISDTALEIARAFDQLSVERQEHVRRQIEFLRDTDHGERRRAARQDVEIKQDALRPRKMRKVVR